MNPDRFRWAALAGAVAVAAIGAACSDPAATPRTTADEPTAASAAKPGQVAARINGEELTVHQINDRLSAWAGADATGGPQSPAVGSTLNRLVELTLLRQEAQAQGLDRRPDVLRAVEGARAEVLARALAQQIGEEESSPAPHQVRRYYDDHPEAFARRRVFHVKEVRAAMPAGESARLVARLEGWRQPQALVQSLERDGHRSVVSHRQVASDQLPLPQLQRIQQLAPGQALPIEDGEGLRVWWLQASVEQPLEWEQAQPAIERLLLTRAKADRLRRELERLRERARIEFLGDFARWAPAASTAATAATAATEAADATAAKGGGEAAQGASTDPSAR